MRHSILLAASLVLSVGLVSCGGASEGLPPAVDSLMANMVAVEGGTFTMGATPEQKTDVQKDEKPLHDVTLSAYSIGRYEVRQDEWEAVMGTNPSELKGEDLPVTNVSWEDCQQFIQKLNEMTGRKFRLPTEAEWEFAARGGNLSKGTQFAGGGDNHKNVAWCFDNAREKTHPVGRKTPNELGLYDMSGNVWEWCNDWYADYPDSVMTDPQGPATGTERCDRGGAWDSTASSLRTSRRDCGKPTVRAVNVGFRLAE
ncbi:MAG: SUMF1/EgtB/PvdO family nonheme iron enzyme [Alloprevotella sp.]|nr:SUMF1/EgtB/PvdO family nonheme iron enzyme [Alloprevotella sp.]